jgi:hypothetical protein
MMGGDVTVTKRSNGFDYDFDSGQCALDFTLHALNLSVQKSTASTQPPAPVKSN